MVGKDRSKGEGGKKTDGRKGGKRGKGKKKSRLLATVEKKNETVSNKKRKGEVIDAVTRDQFTRLAVFNFPNYARHESPRKENGKPSKRSKTIGTKPRGSSSVRINILLLLRCIVSSSSSRKKERKKDFLFQLKKLYDSMFSFFLSFSFLKLHHYSYYVKHKFVR